MKIILSRKGFDSAAGRCPSPIFPDGRFLSLPIPSREAPSRFSDITFDELRIGDLVDSLTNHAYGPDSCIHLDPDLTSDTLERRSGWRPAFGQTDSAQSHLANNAVGVGDLFLFFGWFRNVVRSGTGWDYQSGAPHQHVMFGWLQVNEMLFVGSDTAKFRKSHPWLVAHPHLHMNRTPSNTIYVASEELRLPGLTKTCAGGGTFRTVRPDLVLTSENQNNRSLWMLPKFFQPNGRTPLTYHKNPSRWIEASDDQVHLQSVGRGQEFVLNADEYPEAIAWAAALISGI